MAKQQLDLLQFATGGPAQFGSRAPQVMGRDSGDASSRCVRP
jgi:hypothetical protein